MKIYEATERMPVTVPLAEVLNADGSFSFVPEVKQKGYFDIDYRQNNLVLIAGKFVGQIPLTNDISIHVKPKVPLSNLARVISVANQPIQCLDFFRRKYVLSMEASESLFEGMARSLVVSLKELDSEGLYREYKRINENLSGPRGRVDFGSYIKQSLARGKPTVVPCTYHLLSSDTTFNRVIKLALWLLGRALGQRKTVDLELIRDLEYFSDKFEAVLLERDPALLQRAEVELQQKRIPELRAYYSDIIDICLVILREGVVEIARPGGDLSMHSFVLNLEDTFERYIREVLNASGALRSKGLSIGDGNRDARASLFSDTDIYDAKPDFVLKEGSSCVMIGDAKYKTKLAESDRYQLISHALSFGAPKAFFVTPAGSSAAAGPAYIGLVGHAQSIQLLEYRFDLDAPDLTQEEHRFSDWVAGLSQSAVAA